MRKLISALLRVAVVSLSVAVVSSDDKPEAPRIAFAAPFAVPANATTKVIVRGWKLNRDIEARSTAGDVMLKVLRHDNAPVPNGQDAKQIGDSLAELEVTVPQGFSAETLPITLIASGVESSPYSLLVGGRFPVIAEVEPNDSFRQAQSIDVPQIVDGQIHADRNVDVFAIEFKAERRLLAEVLARRHGSGLDSLLTVFNAKKQIVVSSDDVDGTDSKIDVTLPAGQYYLVVQDAHDHGGATHPYRLVVQVP